MQILIYSLKHRELVDIPEMTEEDVKSFWNEIARGSQLANGCWSQEELQLVNSDKTKENFKRVGEKYLHKSKKLNRIIHFLDGDKKVDANAFFYLFNTRCVVVYRKLAAIEVLKVVNKDNVQWKLVHNMVFDSWARLSFQFDIYAFGIDGVKEVIGEPDKSKRICRFCREPHKPYANIAHAIPEAIGNKLLICAEECDECNGLLREVEDNFIHLMDFRRAMYRVSGKDRTASPKIKGHNYTIAPDENGFPKLYIKQSARPAWVNPNGSEMFKFIHTNHVVDQDIYRALVKMVIDLLPADRLRHFQKTIDWIMKKNQDVIPDALPSVYFGELPFMMNKQPVLYLFFRKEDDMTVPYCTAMLLTTDVVYQFIVPYVDVDNGSFKYDDEMYKLRSKLWPYFNVQWVGQQYFSWWQSFIWNYWPIHPSDSNVCRLPDNNPIFIPEKRYTKEEMQLMDNNIFTEKDILDMRITSLDAEHLIKAIKSKLPKVHSTDEDERISIIFRLNLETNICDFSILIPFKVDGKKFAMDVSLEATINRLDRINCKDKYITGATFSSVAEVLWHKAARLIDRRISLALRMRDVSFIRRFDKTIVQCANFEFILPNGKVIRTDFNSLVR